MNFDHKAEDFLTAIGLVDHEKEFSDLCEKIGYCSDGTHSMSISVEKMEKVLRDVKPESELGMRKIAAAVVKDLQAMHVLAFKAQFSGLMSEEKKDGK